MKIILVLLLAIIGTTLAQTCTQPYSQTFTTSVIPQSTDLLVRSLESRYDTFNIQWRRSVTNNLDVHVTVCSDTQADVTGFNGASFITNTAGGVVVSLGSATPGLTTGTGSTSGPGATTGTNATTTARLTSSTSSTTSFTTGTTGPVAAGSSVTPNTMLYIALASIFVLPKKRFSFAVLLIAVVLFMAAPETAIAAPTATTTVTVTIYVPDSMLTFNVTGATPRVYSRTANGAVTDYFSLFGRRFSSVDGLATPCNASIFYPVPAGWVRAPDDALSRAAIHYGAFKSFLVTLASNTGYREDNSTLFAAGKTQEVATGVPGFAPIYCDNKIAISQEFPIPETKDIAGYPQITNFITFGGHDYATASNTPYNKNTVGCPTFSAYADANSEWKVAANDDGANVAIAAPGYVFGADCFTFADGSSLSSALSNTLCPNRGVNVMPFASGNVYLAPNCSHVLMRRTSDKPNTFVTNIPITRALNMVTNSYALMINTDPRSRVEAEAPPCQTSFLSVPTGYRLTTSTELKNFVDTNGWEFWGTTYCFATSGFSYNHANATCSNVVEKTVGGVTYYYPSICANILLISV